MGGAEVPHASVKEVGAAFTEENLTEHRAFFSLLGDGNIREPAEGLEISQGSEAACRHGLSPLASEEVFKLSMLELERRL